MTTVSAGGPWRRSRSIGQSPGPADSTRRCRGHRSRPSIPRSTSIVIATRPRRPLTGIRAVLRAAGAIDVDPRTRSRELDVRRLLASGSHQFSDGTNRRSGSGNLRCLATSAPPRRFRQRHRQFTGAGEGVEQDRCCGRAADKAGTGAPSGRPTQTPMVMRPSKPTDQASR